MKKRGRPDRSPFDSTRYDVIGECWIWKSKYVTHSGFPLVSIKSKNHRATIIYYEFYKEKIKKGQIVFQKCRNRKCVNPNHLVLTTPKESHRKSCTVKITMEKAEQIRKLYKLQGISQKILGARFGISQSQISRIVNNKRWD